jgi:hypothetical protein
MAMPFFSNASPKGGLDKLLLPMIEDDLAVVDVIGIIGVEAEEGKGRGKGEWLVIEEADGDMENVVVVVDG